MRTAAARKEEQTVHLGTVHSRGQHANRSMSSILSNNKGVGTFISLYDPAHILIEKFRCTTSCETTTCWPHQLSYRSDGHFCTKSFLFHQSSSVPIGESHEWDPNRTASSHSKTFIVCQQHRTPLDSDRPNVQRFTIWKTRRHFFCFENGCSKSRRSCE